MHIFTGQVHAELMVADIDMTKSVGEDWGFSEPARWGSAPSLTCDG